MIEIILQYDGDMLKKLHISGHALKSEDKGYETCIAISTLAQSMLKTIKERLPNVRFLYNKKSGLLEYKLVSKLDKSEDYSKYLIITDSFVFSIKNIAYENREHVTIK